MCVCVIHYTYERGGREGERKREGGREGSQGEGEGGREGGKEGEILLLNCLSSTYRHLYTQHVTNILSIRTHTHPVNPKTIKSLQLCHISHTWDATQTLSGGGY